MNWLNAVKGIVWPTSAPAPAPGAFTFTAQNGAALKGMNWSVPDGWLGGGIVLSDGRSASYAQLYARQPWVFAIVNKLARGIGRLPLKAYQTDAAGERERARNSVLAQVLATPYERGSPSALKQRIVGDMCIYGNAVLVIGRTRPDRPADFLQPMHPQGWRIDDDGNYHFPAPGGPEKVFPPWQILHFKFWRPNDDLGWGLSPLEPLRQALITEDYAQMFASSTFRNGAQPGLALETDKEITDQNLARIRAQFEARHVGGANAGRPLLLTGGLKAKTFETRLDQTAMIETRKLTREEVCAALDIPPPIVGILDRATFSNIEEQGRWLVQHTYNIWTTLIEETIAAQLLPGVAAYAGQFVEFEFGEILRGSLKERFEAYSVAINGGFKTQNEIRKLENDPPHTDPDADLLHRALNLYPAPDAATPAPTASAGGGTGNE